MSPFVALVLCLVAASSVDAFYPYSYYDYYPGELNYYSQYYDYYPYSYYPFRFARDTQGIAGRPNPGFEAADPKIFWGRTAEPSDVQGPKAKVYFPLR